MNDLREALEFLGVDPEESDPSTMAFEMAEALLGPHLSDPDEDENEVDEQFDKAAEIIGEVLLAVLKGEQ